jgi:hypothetical protein
MLDIEDIHPSCHLIFCSFLMCRDKATHYFVYYGPGIEPKLVNTTGRCQNHVIAVENNTQYGVSRPGCKWIEVSPDDMAIMEIHES